MVELVIVVGVLLGVVLAAVSRPGWRYTVIAGIWLLTVVVSWPLDLAMETVGHGQIGASVVALTFPFLWVLVLLRATRLSRRPRLLAVLTPFVFVGSFVVGLLVLVNWGYLSP